MPRTRNACSDRASLRHFLLSTCWYDNIDIYIYLVSTMPNTTLLTPINKSLDSLKVLINSMVYGPNYMQCNYSVLWELDALPIAPFFYYELLVIHNLAAIALETFLCKTLILIYFWWQCLPCMYICLHYFHHVGYPFLLHYL